jgi:chorismate-pyruvate lyase
MNLRCIFLLAAALLPLYAAAQAHPAPAWPDTYLSRLQALALIQTLDADILASNSATLSLEKWCRDHHLADDPVIVAKLETVEPKPPTAEQRQRLQVSPTEEVKYRHVQLQCGSHVLSEADNWYVPVRLSAEMNRQLETSDTPFGKVVRPLEPYRRTFAVQLLWSPLPEGWETRVPAAAPGVGTPLTMPAALFEHRAVLYTREHLPFSEVDEVYQRELLAFPAPPRHPKLRP